ncbi:MAG: TlpA family protein disulfide reductase [Planctomycetaceae bacterium]|jgi:thiol-disulfide isomerase/thioredoxin|nr:TlpA family protein disulfide reductase [Planctomycetaceae bacterium]
MKKFIMFTLPLFVLTASFVQTVFAADDPVGSPAITDSSRTAKIVDSTKTKIDRSLPIDIAKTPWLVESVGVPANSSVFNRDRLLWADSHLFEALTDFASPVIPVEHWVNEPPKDDELTGKYIFVELWATWCPPCRRSLPLLNFFQEKFKDKLVVVAICETVGKAITEMEKANDVLKVNDMKFHLAFDTSRRFANKLGVFGIPHAVLIEPSVGAIVWEGMPTWIGYELDDVTLGKYLAVAEKLKAAGKMPTKSPVTFKVTPPEPKEKLAERDVVDTRLFEK